MAVPILLAGITLLLFGAMALILDRALAARESRKKKGEL
jgi:hypothetical protein